jgi:2Fe-2S iron-sulfur cluster binding domain
MLTRPAAALDAMGMLTIWFDDQAITRHQGDSVATALSAADITATRGTLLSGAPRAGRSA